VIRLAALTLLLCCSVVVAQRELLVNGANVAGLDTRLLPGTAYAPAVDLARALGAALAIDAPAARATLTLGAAIVSIAIAENPDAANAAPALRRDGEVRAGPAALWNAGRLYLPVKAIGEAFGGEVAFVASHAIVAVALPRATLQATIEGAGAFEAIVFSLDAPTRVTSFVRETSGIVELRFDRSDLPEAISLRGSRFGRIDVEASRGSVHAEIDFPPGVPPAVLTLPDGMGMRVVVSFAPPRRDTPVARTADLPARWVLDAHHAMSDPGEATRAFVDALAAALEGRAWVERTRSGPAPVALEARIAAAAAGEGVVAIHEADLPPGTLRLWMLGDAERVAALDVAIRINAQSEVDRAQTDALRRSLALHLTPRPDVGQAWATALALDLTARGWSVKPPLAAPLALLAGAGGRGMLLELGAGDLADPAVVAEIADALLRAWTHVPQ
jgi:hypothetical protein